MHAYSDFVVVYYIGSFIEISQFISYILFLSFCLPNCIRGR